MIHPDNGKEHHLGIDSVMAIPLAEWSIDVVTPQTVCVRKDGQCLQQILPEFGDSTSLVAVQAKEVVRGVGGSDASGQVPAPGYYVIVAQYKGQTGPQDKVKVKITYNNEGEGKITSQIMFSFSHF